jgi:crotonobetainyl-CoA:carnitine CoA-transferase CaiB-like acyl-CoA transferase
MSEGALKGVRVIDFSTLLPGPLATLYLAQAGAEVIKVERLGACDPMREYPPFRDGQSILFEMLNSGKKSIALDLKDRLTRPALLDLIRSADILVEQFRPGVMKRLGLDYEALQVNQPELLYCSISGYGQNGPHSQVAGHDLNYQAWTGLLALTGDAEGKPVVPALVADIAGGTHAAVINLLLALRTRDRTGRGCHLDIAMTDGLFSFMLAALAARVAGNASPASGQDLLTGGSPRYQLYLTADGLYIAAAPLEEHFWQRFSELIELPAEYRSAEADPRIVRRGVANIIARRSAASWEDRFNGEDVCCTVVRTLDESITDPHFQKRGRFKSEAPSILQLLAGSGITSDQAPSCGQHNGYFGFPISRD